MNLKPITIKKQLKNFAVSYDKPFSAGKAIQETNLNQYTVRNYLRDLVREGFLKTIVIRNKKQFVLNRNSNKAGPKPTPYAYTPKREKLIRIINVLKIQDLSISEMSKALSVSKRNLSEYLKVLQVMGLVKRDWRQFHLLSCELPEKINRYNYYHKAFQIRNITEQ